MKYYLFGFLVFVLPFILTIINTINLFKKKKIKEDIVDLFTFILGICYTYILYAFFCFKDYNEPIMIHMDGGNIEFHAPIASWSMMTVIIICLVGIISYTIIRIRILDIPPIIFVISMSGILICSIYMILFIVQISKNLIEEFDLVYFILFPLNYMLCSIRAVIYVIKNYKEILQLHGFYVDKI